MTVKTNAMRILDSRKISYTKAEYEVDESDLSGVHAAASMGLDPKTVFKTLVAKGSRKGYHVFVIPVDAELDLKKCAAAAGDKDMAMIPMKDLLPVTGYIRGGCSPIGMKKAFPTHLDQSAEGKERIYVSAGKRGLQIALSPGDLLRATGGSLAVLTQ
ncbi:MAG: Cys-tRNA(Pro) deacylase [Clostridia bacterium]|nr:Cys-tRNA(Pro) deacylase [Clostridia bacterium]